MNSKQSKDIQHKIDLEQYVLDKKQYRLDLMKVVSECTILNIDGICQIIMEYCCLDDMILIPNTFKKDEFFKYWFVVEKGKPYVNYFRDFHQVKLQSDCLQLIRRGTIASINKYIPSKNAKLILECKFIHKDKNQTDFMSFSTRSNGTRDPTVKYAAYGVPHDGGNKVQISWPFRKLRIDAITNAKLLNRPMSYFLKIPLPPSLKTLSLKLIDDGQHIKYIYNDGLKTYPIESDAYSQNTDDHSVLVYNREQPNNITEITFLQLSVLSNSE
eukprot:511249_1